MSTGGLADGGKGWRTALQHALGDVAQSDLLAPRGRRGNRDRDDVRLSMDLFDDEGV
jgi:hypothetical protein